MVPSDEPIECPDGQYFNPDHTVPRCDPISSGLTDFCSDLCNPCVPDCNMGNPGTVQPDPAGCSTYFICLSDGHVLQETCPPEAPWYDFQTGNCQDDDTLCYEYCDFCAPHCTYEGEYISDPLDCHSFYVCSPPGMAHFLCPSGGVYDPESQLCGDYVCNTLCPSSSPGDFIY